MLEYLGTVTDKQMNMAVYNEAYTEMPNYGEQSIIEDKFSCKTAGCVIGHCIVLDTKLAKELFAQYSVNTAYMIWSEEFTGLENHTLEWKWCFSSSWKYSDNTVKGAIRRIKALIDGTWQQSKDYEDFLNRFGR